MIEVGAQRIAAADQRHFALVEFRIGKADVVLDDADQHQRSAMRDMGKGRLHRLGVAGGIEDHIEAFAAGCLPDQIGHRAARAVEGLESRVRLRRKPSRSLLMSSSVTSSPAMRAKMAVPSPIGPAPMTSVRAPGSTLRAPHGMRADGQELDGGGVGQRQAVGRIEILRRHQDPFAHGAVAMDAEHLDPDAAIRLAVPAGDAFAAGKVGVDDDRLRRWQARRLRRSRQRFPTLRGP